MLAGRSRPPTSWASRGRRRTEIDALEVAGEIGTALIQVPIPRDGLELRHALGVYAVPNDR